MKNLFFAILGFSALSIIVGSCTKYVGLDPALQPKAFVLVCDSVKYSKDIKPIIDTKCAISGCHVTGGIGNGVFSDYNAVYAKVSSGAFKSYVIDNVPEIMPRGGPRLHDTLIAKIQCWLNAGAPNN